METIAETPTPARLLDYPPDGPWLTRTLGQLLRLAGPTIGTSISFTLMQFVDGWLVSILDRQTGGPAVNLAATFNGGILALVPVAFLAGIASCVNTVVSQSLGSGREKDAGAYAWQGLWIAIFSGALLWPMWFLGRPIFAAVHHAPALLKAELLFFHVMVLIGPVQVAMNMLGNFFLGVHRPGIQLVAGVAGNIVNLLLDVALIFGKWGFPRLGLLGAAIATSVASIVSLLILFSLFMSLSYATRYGTRRMWRLVPSKLWKLLRIGLPAGVQFGNDVLCWTTFSIWLVGQFGIESAEAQSAVMRYVTLSFMPAIGVGVAITAMVGRRIGAGDRRGANRAAYAGLLLCMTYMGSCGVLFFLFRHALAQTFLATPQGLRIAANLFICAAVFQLFDAMNVVFICALRGAGDTFLPTIMTAIMAWGVCILGGWWIVHAFPQLGALGPWVTATAYICILGVFNLFRWRSGVWRKLNVLGNDLISTPAR